MKPTALLSLATAIFLAALASTTLGSSSPAPVSAAAPAQAERISQAMPWTVYRNMTDEDRKAVFAYLKTLKPMKNAVRSAPSLTSTQRGARPRS